MFRTALSQPWSFVATSLVSLGTLHLTRAGQPEHAPQVVYVGTYSGGGSQGIYRMPFDADSGALGSPSLAAKAENPSFLTFEAKGRFLYAVSEVSRVENRPQGAVNAYRVESSGDLTLLNAEPTRGEGPCHLTLDRRERFVLVANYGGGSVATLPVLPDGRLGSAADFRQHEGSGPNRQRQTSPHAHGAYPDPANRFLFVPDLGTDQIVVWRFDPDAGRLQPNEPAACRLPPGSGPRHLAFHPDGRRVYSLQELNSTLAVLDWDAARGVLHLRQELSTLPAETKAANSTAEVQVHPSGKFLYASNRGHDSIAIFRVDPATGRLEPAGHCGTGGKTPRHFALDPSGRWLLAANQDSGTVLVLRVNEQSGQLTPAGAAASVPNPVCLVFRPQP